MEIKNLKSRWCSLFKPYSDINHLQQEFDNLAAHYGEPARHYHTLRHIHVCLQSLDQVVDKISDCFSLECAIWFHDVIYDPAGSDNEELSAKYAGTFLAKIGVASNIISKIEHLIVLTKHPAYPTTDDEKYLLDIDLAILGIEPKSYNHYTQWIRHEYSFVPENLYSQGRSSVLQTFLDRARIFETTHYYDRYEAQARKNLADEIEQLQQ